MIAIVSGSLILNVDPRPTSEVISIFPRSFSMFRFTTSMPTPRPETDVTFSAVENPGLIAEAATYFGSQCIVVAIDARRVQPWNPNTPRWQVTTHGGRTVTEREAVDWAQEAAARGAGEILLTSMDRDGTQEGYDNLLNRTIAERVGIPVIASGGCGSLQHIADAFTEGQASAALAASIFHFGQHTIAEAKQFLLERGIPVRIN